VVQRAAPESGPGQRRCCGNHDNAGPPTPGTAGRAEEEEEEEEAAVEGEGEGERRAMETRDLFRRDRQRRAAARRAAPRRAFPLTINRISAVRLRSRRR